MIYQKQKIILQPIYQFEKLQFGKQTIIQPLQIHVKRNEQNYTFSFTFIDGEYNQQLVLYEVQSNGVKTKVKNHCIIDQENTIESMTILFINKYFLDYR